MVATAINHIQLDIQGVAWVADTTAKVIEIVLAQNAFGFDTERNHTELPNLSLAQVHAALSYYYDHREMLDNEISLRFENAEASRVLETGQLTRDMLETRKRFQSEKST